MMELQIAIANTKEWLAAFYHSGFFLLIRILLGIYTAVLFVDIVLILIQRGVGANLREFTTGMDVPLELTKRKKGTRTKWLEIRKRLESGNENEYKVAVIEADQFIGDIIGRMGYSGDNFGEILENIHEGQIENVEGMRMAHETRNKIIHDERFILTLEEAREALGQFEEFLKSYQVID